MRSTLTVSFATCAHPHIGEVVEEKLAVPKGAGQNGEQIVAAEARAKATVAGTNRIRAVTIMWFSPRWYCGMIRSSVSRYNFFLQFAPSVVGAWQFILYNFRTCSHGGSSD